MKALQEFSGSPSAGYGSAFEYYSRPSTPPPNPSSFFASLLPSTPTSSSFGQGEGTARAILATSPGFGTAFAGFQGSPLSPLQSLFDMFIRNTPFNSPTRPHNAEASGGCSSGSGATAGAPSASAAEPQPIPQLTDEAHANSFIVPSYLASSAGASSEISGIQVDAHAGQFPNRVEARAQVAHPRKRCRSDASVEAPSDASLAREVKKIRLQPMLNASSSSSSSNGDDFSAISTPPTTPGDDGGALPSSEHASPLPADHILGGDDQDGKSNDENDEDSKSEEAAEARRKAKGKGRAVEGSEVETPAPEADFDVGSDLGELEAEELRQAMAASHALARSTRYAGEASTSSGSHWGPPSVEEDAREDGDTHAPEGEEGGDCGVPTLEEVLQILQSLPSGGVEQDSNLGDTPDTEGAQSTGPLVHAEAPLHSDTHHTQQRANHPFVQLQVESSTHPIDPIDPIDPHHHHRHHQQSHGSGVWYATGGVLDDPYQQTPLLAPHHPRFSQQDYPSPQNSQHLGGSSVYYTQASNTQRLAIPGTWPYNVQVDGPHHSHPASYHLHAPQVVQHVGPSPWQRIPPVQQHGSPIPHPPPHLATHHVQQSQATQASVNAPGSYHIFQLILPTHNLATPAPNGNGASPAVSPSNDTRPTGQNRPKVGSEAATPGASNHDDLHTCGWLVDHDKVSLGKCGSSIRNDKESIARHIAEKHDIDPESSERKNCGWAAGESLGKSNRCTHDPAQQNLAKSIHKLHMGPKAFKRVCDYPTCMVPTGTARRCPAHRHAAW